MSTARNKDDSRDKTSGYDSAASDIELLYVWIERDKADFIRKIGFNLSPNYRFAMKCTEEGNYELSCTEKHDYHNIWKYGSINGLTALVGENGSGKSLLLKHLWEFGMEHKNYPFMTVYVYLANGKVQIRHNFPQERFINTTRFNVEHTFCSQARIYISNGLSSQGFSRAVLPGGQRIIITPEDNNIRFKQFFQVITSVDKPDDCQPDFNVLQEEVISCVGYKNFETLCVLGFYHHLKSREAHDSSLITGVATYSIDVLTPHDLFRPDEVKSSFSRIMSGRTFKYLMSFKEWEENTLARIGSDPVAKAYIPLIYELGYLLKVDCNHNVDVRGDLEDYAKELLNRLKERQDSHNAVIVYYENALKEIRGLGKRLPKSFIKGNTAGTVHRVYVMIDRRKYPSIYDDFCQYIDELMRKKNSFLPKYIHINLQPQSSGEQALQNIFTWLSLYSSFGEILNEKTAEIGHNILLLLDEVDLYMHPEWQRKFLKLLSDELNAVYPDKNIQVIISTHSPLVLSDIPSANCIYLKHEGDICTFASGPEENRTFGANIFALLKDSFFMKKSLGEFAYSKIVWISHKLNELKGNPDLESREQYRYLDKLIDLIGEPVVRRKLQMLYDEVFADHTDAEHHRFLEELNGLYMSEDPEDRKKYQDILKVMRSGSFGN